MAVSQQIIQGTWDDIAAHADELQGRQLTLIVSEEGPEAAPMPRLDEKAVSLLLYLQERLTNAPTDPELIRQAETELAELHSNLNKNRLEAGETPLFPE
jgi:hypothetical protein